MWGTPSSSLRIPHTCVSVASWTRSDSGTSTRRGFPATSPLPITWNTFSVSDLSKLPSHTSPEAVSAKPVAATGEKQD